MEKRLTKEQRKLVKNDRQNRQNARGRNWQGQAA